MSRALWVTVCEFDRRFTLFFNEMFQSSTTGCSFFKIKVPHIYTTHTHTDTHTHTHTHTHTTLLLNGPQGEVDLSAAVSKVKKEIGI